MAGRKVFAWSACVVLVLACGGGTVEEDLYTHGLAPAGDCAAACTKDWQSTYGSDLESVKVKDCSFDDDAGASAADGGGSRVFSCTATVRHKRTSSGCEFPGT